jgi:hypothetical protein
MIKARIKTEIKVQAHQGNPLVSYFSYWGFYFKYLAHYRFVIPYMEGQKI